LPERKRAREFREGKGKDGGKNETLRASTVSEDKTLKKKSEKEESHFGPRKEVKSVKNTEQFKRK